MWLFSLSSVRFIMKFNHYMLLLLGKWLLLGIPAFSQTSTDSLFQSLDQQLSKHKTGEAAETLIRIGNELHRLDPVAAVKTLRRAASMAEKNGNAYVLGKAYSMLGNIYYDQRLYSLAMEFQIKCYQLYEDAGFSDSLGYVFIDIGNIYYARELLDLPYQYYRKSEQIFSKTDNLWGLAVANNNLALIKQRSADLDSAVYFFTIALNYRQEMNNPFVLAHSYRYLGVIQQKKKNYQGAAQYFRDAEEHALASLKMKTDSYSQAQIRSVLADIHRSSGSLHTDLRNYESAKASYLEALNIHQDFLRDDNIISDIYLNLADVYRLDKQWVPAESYAMKGLALAEKLNRNERKMQAFVVLISLYEDQARADKAIRYIRAYREASQQESDPNKLEKLANLQSLLRDYEIQKQLEHSEQAVRQRNTENTVLLAVIGFLVLVALGIYRHFRIRVRNSVLLEQKNALITNQAAELENQKKILELQIEERKKIEFEARKLFTAIEQSANTVIITGLDGRIEYVNPKFSFVTGYTPAEVIGKNPRILKSKSKRPEDYKELWETVLAGRVWKGVFLNVKKDGTEYWEETTITPVKNPEGTVEHFIAIKEDITDRKRTEEALRLNETRLNSLLELSQGSQLLSEEEIVREAIDDAIQVTESITGYCCIVNPDRTFGEPVIRSAGDFPYGNFDPTSLNETLQTCSRTSQTVLNNQGADPSLQRHLAVPVMDSGETRIIMGVLDKPANYDESDVRQMQLIAGDIWKIILRKRLELEKEKIIRDLQEALAKVKTLSGLLPICASCKKVRDDQGYWHQIENYIATHSEVDFSHSICKDCQHKLYPELFNDD